MTARPTRSRAVMLDADEERVLIERAQRGDKRASDKLVLAYRPLAIRFAQDAARQGGGDVEDLVQEAMLALLETVPLFEVSRGHRFGTFARWHIMHRVSQHGMLQKGPVAVGKNIADKKVYQQYRRRRAAWEARNHVEEWGDAGRAEIAAEMSVPVEVVERMEPRLVGGDISLYQPALSSHDENGPTVLDSLAERADEGPAAHAALEEEERREVLDWALRVALDPREREVVERTMAVGSRAGQKPEMLRDVGASMGITGERVRQLQKRAVERLQRAVAEAPSRRQRQADLGMADVIHAILTAPPSPRRPRKESRARRARRREARRHISPLAQRLPLPCFAPETQPAAA